jgi:hypothetical protein
MAAPARTLLVAQLGFFACLGACVLLDAAGLSDNHGWSYYGGRSQTFVPYALGFLVLILLIGRAAAQLELTTAPREIAGGLRTLAALLLLDLATPDTVNSVFYWAHDVASTALFLYELWLAVRLVRIALPNALGVGLLVAQLAGGIVAMFSQLQLIGLLSPGILAYQVSFGALLVVAVERIARAASQLEVGEPAVEMLSGS